MFGLSKHWNLVRLEVFGVGDGFFLIEINNLEFKHCGIWIILFYPFTEDGLEGFFGHSLFIIVSITVTVTALPSVL